MNSVRFGLILTILSVAAGASAVPETAPDTAKAQDTSPTAATSSASSTPASTLAAEATQAKDAPRFMGKIELRPSWRSGAGSFHAENSAFVGYKFSSAFQLGYKQYFSNNLYNPAATTAGGGLGLAADEGFFELKAKDILKSGGTSLSYESRGYVPTLRPKRDAGMLTTFRNYFIVKQKLTSAISVLGFVCPTLHVYDRAGIALGRGGAANPDFEQRNYLAVEVNFTKSLALFFPLKVVHTHYRDFAAGARNNATWGHKAYVDAVLTYQVTSQAYVGLGYRSENLIQSDFSGTAVGDGFDKGVTHFVIGAAF